MVASLDSCFFSLPRSFLLKGTVDGAGIQYSHNPEPHRAWSEHTFLGSRPKRVTVVLPSFGSVPANRELEVNSSQFVNF